MDKTDHQLRARLARLESQVDQLETEYTQINEMLIRCGFLEGISTLKFAMEELLVEYPDESSLS